MTGLYLYCLSARDILNWYEDPEFSGKIHEFFCITGNGDTVFP